METCHFLSSDMWKMEWNSSIMTSFLPASLSCQCSRLTQNENALKALRAVFYGFSLRPLCRQTQWLQQIKSLESSVFRQPQLLNTQAWCSHAGRLSPHAVLGIFQHHGHRAHVCRSWQPTVKLQYICIVSTNFCISFAVFWTCQPEINAFEASKMTMRS